jgi:hypothetical protein
LVVLDEIQHRHDLFPALRALADRPGRPASFLILSSASPRLIRATSESLAGRIAHYELGGLSLGEVGASELQRLWLRGGFPRSFLAASEGSSVRWRRDLIRSFVERDLAALGIRIPVEALRRFWMMLAHYHGQLWNAAELARAFGVAEKSVRHYLDILCGTFLVRRLEPYFVNIQKRAVKAPKIYLCDGGLLHTILGIERREELLRHPKVGASWEGFVIQELMGHLDAHPEECFFWKLHTGAELDLLVVRGERRLGFEVKHTSGPGVTPSMRSAIEALGLESLDVLHAGAETHPLAPRIRAVAAARMLEDIQPLR